MYIKRPPSRYLGTGEWAEKPGVSIGVGEDVEEEFFCTVDNR